MFTKSIKLIAILILTVIFVQSNSEAKDPQKFRVKIENITSGNILKSKTGETAPLAFAPGLYIVHTTDAPIFKTGEKQWGKGLESLAEDGNPGSLAENVKTQKGIVSTGIFNTPVGDDKPGPITPGKYFEFEFIAEPGQNLTIAQMWGQSNDLFYAPNERGIVLFDNNGKPISGDITRQFILWDAGTEVNEEPGFGPNQGPRQSAENTGPDENGVVTAVVDGWGYAPTATVIKYTITPVTKVGSK